MRTWFFQLTKFISTCAITLKKFCNAFFAIVLVDLSQKCGGILTSQSGRISSPGYPITPYPTNKHCLWVIRVPNAKKIRLAINFFDVHKTAFCLDDYMLLYKRGLYSPKNGADKYCGREIDIAPAFTYNSDEVWIQFNSRARPSYLAPRGFDIRYSSEEKMTTVKPTTMTGMCLMIITDHLPTLWACALMLSHVISQENFQIICKYAMLNQRFASRIAPSVASDKFK